MTTTPVNLGVLRASHASELIEPVEILFSQGGPFEISVDGLASQTSRSEREAECLLQCLCPPLTRRTVPSCRNCGESLENGESTFQNCPGCGQNIAENGGEYFRHIFNYDVPRTRDVAWVLALHGMNTRGCWQEEFAWRVSTAYKRSVPVSIYKYGLVRPGAIWLPSLKTKVRKLVERIHTLRGDIQGNGFAGQPDVIAHSLGTWLIGHALLWNPTLKVGRVILVGSVLRPDFDWGELLRRGQVEAVLNHYGTCDFWAGLAELAIPDSGPSGRRGFEQQVNIAQHEEAGFGHSDFFRPQNLPGVFKKVWQPFLTGRIDIESLVEAEHPPWTPATWILRATIAPLVILAAFWGSLLILASCCLLGLYEGFRWLLGR